MLISSVPDDFEVFCNGTVELLQPALDWFLQNAGYIISQTVLEPPERAHKSRAVYDLLTLWPVCFLGLEQLAHERVVVTFKYISDFQPTSETERRELFDNLVLGTVGRLTELGFIPPVPPDTST